VASGHESDRSAAKKKEGGDRFLKFLAGAVISRCPCEQASDRGGGPTCPFEHAGPHKHCCSLIIDFAVRNLTAKPIFMYRYLNILQHSHLSRWIFSHELHFADIYLML
jgi:hypothetical protein